MCQRSLLMVCGSPTKIGCHHVPSTTTAIQSRFARIDGFAARSIADLHKLGADQALVDRQVTRLDLPRRIRRCRWAGRASCETSFRWFPSLLARHLDVRIQAKGTATLRSSVQMDNGEPLFGHIMKGPTAPRLTS